MEEREIIEELKYQILEFDKSLTSYQQKEFLKYWEILLKKLEGPDYGFNDKYSRLKGMKLKMISLNKLDSLSNYADFSIEELKLRCLLICKYAYRGNVRYGYLYHDHHDFCHFNGFLYAKFDKYGLSIDLKIINSLVASHGDINRVKWFDFKSKYKRIKSNINYKNNYEFRRRINNGIYSVLIYLLIGTHLLVGLLFFLAVLSLLTIISGIEFSFLNSLIDVHMNILDWVVPFYKDKVSIGKMMISKSLIFYPIFIIITFTIGYIKNYRSLDGLFKFP